MSLAGFVMAVVAGPPAAMLASATEADPDGREWLAHFSAEHALTVLVAGAWTALVIWAGLRLRNVDRAAPAPRLEGNYRRTLGVVGFGFAAVYHIYWLTPPRLDPADSLPLHVCDLLSVLAPLSMVLPRRFLQTLTYFWGIGLSSQGFITPVETAGPNELRFWIFWLAHVQVVGIGLYHVIVCGYRPRGHDVLLAILAGAVYVLPILVLNETFGVNYGYLGSGDRQPGIVAKLGPWPLRVLWMFLLASAGFVLLWLPWWLKARIRAGAAVRERAA